MPREKKADLQERALEILRRLEKTYPDADCALKWRNAFELLVATILSAQATDEHVNRVTPGLFERYPNPAAFAAATQAEIEEAIKSINLFRTKAKNLRAMSQQLLEDHNGEV
ncbi:MAG: endonuclease III domain-containing protein, partial [Candidatus Zipacnadales bacterium]